MKAFQEICLEVSCSMLNFVKVKVIFMVRKIVQFLLTLARGGTTSISSSAKVYMSCVGAPFDMKTQSKPKYFEKKMIGVILETT